MSTDCPICIEDTGKGVRLQCGHSYHVHCISKWCENTCPMCRTLHIDNRSKRIARRLHRYKSLTALPTETLLGFRSALPIQMYSQVDPSMLNDEVSQKFFAMAKRNKDILDDSLLTGVTNRWDLLFGIRKEVAQFDKRAHEFANMDCNENNHIKILVDRMSMSFEMLHNRVKDSTKEFNYIKHDESKQAKRLRSRLCHFYKIEKAIQQFENTFVSTSVSPFARAIIPFPVQRRSISSLTDERSLAQFDINYLEN